MTEVLEMPNYCLSDRRNVIIIYILCFINLYFEIILLIIFFLISEWKEKIPDMRVVPTPAPAPVQTPAPASVPAGSFNLSCDMF